VNKKKDPIELTRRIISIIRKNLRRNQERIHFVEEDGGCKATPGKKCGTFFQTTVGSFFCGYRFYESS